MKRADWMALGAVLIGVCAAVLFDSLGSKVLGDRGERAHDAAWGARVFKGATPGVRSGTPSAEAAAYSEGLYDRPSSGVRCDVRAIGLKTIRFMPSLSLEQGAAMSAITEALSNAAQSVARDLREERYREVKQFGRVMWFESIDKAQCTVWRVTAVPVGADGTSTAVGAVAAVVYRDTELREEDPGRSFQINLCPQTGALRAFWWGDRHEVLIADPNRGLSLGRDLGGTRSSVQAWDCSGRLLSSNAYDWSVRGRVISGWTASNTPVYDTPPMRERD